MMKPVQLSWHHVHPSPIVERRVRDKAAHLERFFDRISSCAVTLEAPSHHHRQTGPKYRVRVEISVPGGRLVVGRDPTKTIAHGDLMAAVNAAFREVRRQLQDHVRRLDQRVKAHAPPSRAVVARLFPEDGYGFLQTPDGREIYFHQHSVLRRGFGRLHVGSAVRFAEEPGDQGPQASTVALRRTRAP
jgi:cold shock CspA family protein